MQTRFRSLLLYCIAAMFLFSACSKSNKEGRYIPKNAAIIVLVNGESLSSKLPWNEVKTNELFKGLYTDSSLDAFVKTALDNPDNTGMDTKKDFLFYAQKDSLGGYVAVEGTLKDAAKFKAFNSELTRTTTETEKDGVHYLSGTKITASWDKEKFVILVDAPQMANNGRRNRYDDSNLSSSAAGKRDLKAACAQIFSLQEDNSMAKNEKFSDLVDKKADIHFWMNVGEISAGSVPAMGPMSMLNLTKLTEGSVTTATMNFENGKINVDMKSYAGKEMTELTKKYSGSKINSDMIKRIPSKDVAFLVALNFKPEGIREFIKLAGMEGFANMGMSYIGLTLDDFIKANKGDILFTIYDLVKNDSTGRPNINGMFAASIGDKNSFGKLIEAMNKLSKDKMGTAPMPFGYSKSDEYFAIGSKKEQMDKYVNSGGNNNFDFLDKISGSPVAMYVNFKSIIPAIAGATRGSRDSLDNVAYDATLKMWDNLIVSGGDFKDGGVTQHIEVNLINKSTNSLKQLNTYLGLLGSIQQKKKEDMNKMMYEGVPVDTSAVMAPVENKAGTN